MREQDKKTTLWVSKGLRDRIKGLVPDYYTVEDALRIMTCLAKVTGKKERDTLQAMLGPYGNYTYGSRKTLETIEERIFPTIESGS